MPNARAKTKTGIGSKAKIWLDNGHFSVQLYSTVIYDETAGKITLNHGGWVTPTTTRYINQCLMYRGFEPIVRIRKGVMSYGLNEFIDGKYTMTRTLCNGY